ncbi:MAG: hypothetical protein V5A39_02565 [Haloarculaceae archaeon]
MDVSFRTLLRLFLVVGGLGYVAWGALDARTTFVGLGLLAVALGLFGLWREGFGRKTGG